MNQEDMDWVEERISKRLQPGCLGTVLAGLVSWAVISSVFVYQLWQRLEAISK